MLASGRMSNRGQGKSRWFWRLIGVFIGAAIVLLISLVIANIVALNSTRLWMVTLLYASVAIILFMLGDIRRRLRTLEWHHPAYTMNPKAKREIAKLVIRYCRNEIPFREFMNRASEIYEKSGPDAEIAGMIGAIEHTSIGPDQTEEDFHHELIRDAEEIVSRTLEVPDGHKVSHSRQNIMPEYIYVGAGRELFRERFKLDSHLKVFYTLDLLNCWLKDEFVNTLKKSLEFPDYFGGNFNAIIDCLRNYAYDGENLYVEILNWKDVANRNEAMREFTYEIFDIFFSVAQEVKEHDDIDYYFYLDESPNFLDDKISRYQRNALPPPNEHLSDVDKEMLDRFRERWYLFERYLSDNHLRGCPCPSCGYPTLSGRQHFEICAICGWEDDGQDDPQADEVWGGPNGALSLTDSRLAIGKVLAELENETRRKLVVDPARVLKVLDGRASMKNELGALLEEDTK